MRGVFLLAFLLVLVSSCTIAPKYHSKGFNISWNSKRYEGPTTYLLSNGQKPYQKSNSSTHQKIDLSLDKSAYQHTNSTSLKQTITNTQRAEKHPLDSLKQQKPKKSLEEMEAGMRSSEERIRKNFIGFAALLSPLLINSSRSDSKFIRGWNITFITLSLIAFFFAIFYCLKYVFQWTRYTIAKHTRR